jgi:dynein heavy chain 1
MHCGACTHLQARLRDLEEKLLLELNSVTGNILDNDSIILSLESIKKEAQEVADEVRGAAHPL